MSDQTNAVQSARAQARPILRLAFFFSVFTNLLMLTGPLFMLQVYDRVLASRSEETLVALFGLVVLLYAFYGLLEFARGRVVARVGARYQAGLGPEVFRRVTALRAAGRAEEAGLQEVEAIRTFYTSPLLLALFDLPWTPVFLGAIFIFHPLLGWLALAGAGVLVVVALINQLVTHTKVARAQGMSNAANQFARQVHHSGAFVQAQGMGAALENRWRQREEMALSSTISANDLTGVFTSFTRASRLLLQSAVLALGAWLVLQNELTAGAMIAGSILMGRALAPIEQALPQWPVAQRARRAWGALTGMLENVDGDVERTELPVPAAAVNARDVFLTRKPGQPPVLRNITFYVAPGEALGIIGKSGSGKSTLARVLLGIQPPTAGEIRLGGAAMSQYGAERLGQLIGYLPQEIQFFDGTVAENIARMAEKPDAAAVVAAAQRARVHDVILKLPDGYDTDIGPSNTQLSGGQQQRLALARALYCDPLVLVLDEPNSALDSEGSDALNTVIAEMKKDDKSVIVMTHRPGAIAECDQLLVMEEGRAAGYGPRDEIIRSMIKNADNVHAAVKKGAKDG